MSDKETITKKELAERWGVTRRTIERLERAGSIPTSIKVSPQIKFWRLADILAHEDSLARGTRPPAQTTEDARHD